MCGIFGSLGFTLRENDKDEFVDSLSHRGPDDFGHVDVAELATLGMTRLAIVDPSPQGKQPMAFEESNLFMVFNGEIYNHRELRTELENANVLFHSSSDTEVLFRGFEKYGESFLERVDGMFSAVIVDSKRKLAFLFRDKFGQKPLFTVKTKTGIVFSSDLRSLRRYIPYCSLQDEDLFEYLKRGYLDSNSKILGAANIIKRNTITIVDLQSQRENFRMQSKAREQRSTKFSTGFQSLSSDGQKKVIVEALKESLKESFSSSDVEVGLFLSSGVDSSLLAVLASEIGYSPQTFTVNFGENSVESVYSKALCSKLGLRNIEIEFDIDTSKIIESVSALDVPLADSSYPAYYFLCKEASKYVKTVVGGDGADEIFAGYETYLASKYWHISRILRHLPGLKKSISFLNKYEGEAGQLNISSKLDRWIYNSVNTRLESHSNWRQIFSTVEIEHLVEAKKIENSVSVFGEFESAGSGSIRELLLYDQEHWLQDDVLVKVDRASMAHGLEVRSPFISDRVSSYSELLTEEELIRGFKTKKILREILSERGYPDIANRKKRGFGSPLRKWISKDQDKILEVILGNKELNSTIVESLMKEQISGKVDNTFKIYSLFVLCIWKDYSLC